jgi:hypothetical protein
MVCCLKISFFFEVDVVSELGIEGCFQLSELLLSILYFAFKDSEFGLDGFLLGLNSVTDHIYWKGDEYVSVFRPE